jgi:hypothetical protein
MKKRTVRSVIGVIGVLVAIAAIVGYYLYNKGPLNVKGHTGTEATPTELYSLYTTDSSAAFKKYDDEVLKITGEIKDVSTNNQKQQVILLKTSTEGGNINCSMTEPVPGAKAGDRVTIKGVCNGLGEGDPDLGIPGDVYLTLCVPANE